MPLRTIYKDRGIKTVDEVITFIEEFCDIKLMQYQKLFLKNLLQNECKKWG